MCGHLMAQTPLVLEKILLNVMEQRDDKMRIAAGATVMECIRRGMFDAEKVAEG